MNDEQDKLEAFLKEQERRYRWYWGFQHETYTAAIERGKKDPRNCQKCGGQGFVSVLKSYGVQSKPFEDGTRVTGRRWIWTVSPCECLNL